MLHLRSDTLPPSLLTLFRSGGERDYTHANIVLLLLQQLLLQGSICTLAFTISIVLAAVTSVIANVILLIKLSSSLALSISLLLRFIKTYTHTS